MTKILFSVEMSKDDDLYLNFLSFNYPVEWEKDAIYFPYDQENNIAMMENQKSAVIRFKNLTQQYKNGLEFIVEQIMQNIKMGDVKKVLKTI